MSGRNVGILMARNNWNSIQSSVMEDGADDSDFEATTKGGAEINSSDKDVLVLNLDANLAEVSQESPGGEEAALDSEGAPRAGLPVATRPRPGALRSASEPRLSRARPLGLKALGPGAAFRARPPFKAPSVDRFGFPRAQPSKSPDESWNGRHHLNGSENELKPRGLRRYFSAPQSHEDLRTELSTSSVLKNTKSILANLDSPKAAEAPRSPLSADAGAPVCPSRHVFGGTMKDLDGAERTWNDRWHKSMALLNDNLHKDHRAYFTQNSLFEESPSQQYRRYLDQEVSPGNWKSISMKKAPLFPPL
eukprot:CAMPEP_0168369518 /NCGR_PEP_ID=MMETSP0228-20121227/6796_1 /TAXON_ID=133427 /ORGANISM="Protoceratium reticulatum, Strain CCCM 535 (=CCMP 1889)" /LENGTH=305 /DNA_ID=CAMNT_0008382375 /DNA_START=36 /DNA_END=950 /DNA_ORIENTATION=-